MLFGVILLLAITFGGLIYIAMKGELTVFHDTKDVLNSVGIFVGPVVTLLILFSFLGDDSSNFTNWIVIIISFIPFFWFSYQCFKISIKCNGQKWGIIIGTGKVFLSILMIIFVWGLLSKFTRGEYKNPGTAILMFVFVGVFAWVLKVLVNGEKAAEYRAITKNYQIPK